MTRKLTWYLTAMIPRHVAVGLTLVTITVFPIAAQAQSLDTVVRWNRVLLDGIIVAGANPSTVFVHRPMAIVSVAVFDTANSFDRMYRPYATRVDPAPGASRDAAVAQAAHDALVALLPSLRGTFDAALAASMTGIAEDAAREGSRVGAAVAKATLERRANDGWNRTPPPLVLPSLPGYWKPTPPANQAATFTHYPGVDGFIVADGRRFLMEGPPPLASARYATDFNETKSVGAVDSTTRTAEQTQMARLWHGVGTTTTSPNLWNIVLADVARARGWSGLDAARGFALLNMTQHDALMTSFTGKFLYGLWRPVTAIREADRDGNPATEADPNWTPLLATPPYPGHPGNRACLSASQARLLDRLFGQDHVPFQVTWVVTNGPSVTRGYNGFRQLADEEARSRIWGGIHFEFESLASMGACTLLADYAIDNTLRRP
ncbi:MAG: vanadium-dependent haloperoxidase [Vicinamibacterales bacterium]